MDQKKTDREFALMVLCETWYEIRDVIRRVWSEIQPGDADGTSQRTGE